MEQFKKSAVFEVAKINADEHLAFGWAYQSRTADGRTVIDHSGEFVDIRTLEKAAYKFVELYREGSEMHERGGVGVLVESIVFTPEKIQALGLSADALPLGWWCGFKITDEGVWEKVKSGIYRMFSIEGRTHREEVIIDESD